MFPNVEKKKKRADFFALLLDDIGHVERAQSVLCARVVLLFAGAHYRTRHQLAQLQKLEQQPSVEQRKLERDVAHRGLGSTQFVAIEALQTQQFEHGLEQDRIVDSDIEINVAKVTRALCLS